MGMDTRFVIAALLVLSGLASLAVGAEKLKCEEFPSEYSRCSEWGDAVCSETQQGDCSNCGGPGGLPRKTCKPVEYENTCASTTTECGLRDDGNCMQDCCGVWYCNTTIMTDAECEITNC